MGLVVLCVLEEDLVHVRAGVLVQLVAAAEDYQGDFTVTEHRQFVSFFHHSELSFVESHLEQNYVVVYSLISHLTCLFLSSVIRDICIFFLPILAGVNKLQCPNFDRKMLLFGLVLLHLKEKTSATELRGKR